MLFLFLFIACSKPSCSTPLNKYNRSRIRFSVKEALSSPPQHCRNRITTQSNKPFTFWKFTSDLLSQNRDWEWRQMHKEAACLSDHCLIWGNVINVQWWISWRSSPEGWEWWKVSPAPVKFNTTPHSGLPLLAHRTIFCLCLFLREWCTLFAYRVTGSTLDGWSTQRLRSTLTISKTWLHWAA